MLEILQNQKNISTLKMQASDVGGIFYGVSSEGTQLPGANIVRDEVGDFSSQKFFPLL